ncbi:MAG: hypothetical protein JNN25_06470 [Candidatus Kapabacteria bacterium]|nr:hypothetical protein [Candidatus Kapabacteria bacterium]
MMHHTMMRSSITGFLSFLFFIGSSAAAFSQSTIVWQQTSGPAGGSVNAFAEAQTGLGYTHQYAATNGGLYTANSSERGRTWKRAGLTGLSIKDVSAYSNHVIAVADTSPQKVYYSDNAGQAWREIAAPARIFSAVLLPVSERSPAIVISTAQGVYRYENAQWKQLATASTLGIQQFAGKVLCNSKGHIFVNAGASLWRSTDDGATWKKVANHFPQQLSFAINQKGEMVIAYNCGGIFRSTDNGETWQDIRYNSNELCIHAVGIAVDGTIFCAPFQGGVKKLVSGVAGWSWLPISEGLPQYKYPNRTVVNEPSVMFVNSGMLADLSIGTDVFISRIEGSTAPAMRLNQEKNTWEAIGTTSLLNSNILQLKTAADGTLYAATEQGMFRSSDTDNGSFWVSIQNDLPAIPRQALEIAQDGSIIVGTTPSGAYRSTTRGASWVKISSLPSVQTISKHSDGTLIATSGSDGLYQSSDNGASWTKITTDPTDYYSSAFYSSDKKVLFGSSFKGLMRSADAGKTWTNVFANDPAQAKEVFAYALSPTGQIVIGTRDSGMYRSPDNGASWIRIGLEALQKNPTAPYSITSCVINSQGHIFVTTAGSGMYRSTNNGSSWEQLNAGLSTTWTTALSFASDGSLFIGTQGSGVFRSNNAQTSVQNNAEQQSQLSLRVSPNPVSDGAVIGYTLATRSFVTMDIFTPLGQTVANLVSATQEIGEHSIQVPASILSTLANGAYFCRLRAGNSVRIIPLNVRR